MRWKGQTAVEYLMTYGWAILVVLVVGVVMWQMGFLEMSRGATPDKRGFSQVTPLDWFMKPDGTFSAVVVNNAGTILNVDSAGAIVIMGGGSNPICSTVAASLQTGTPFRPGAARTLNFTGCPLASGTKMGDYYRVNLTIGYNNPSSGLPHVSNGVVWGPIG
jgi:hypothetical protein